MIVADMSMIEAKELFAVLEVIEELMAREVTNYIADDKNYDIL
jgi:DNA-binding GntR family transcriptional regulator